MFVNITKYIHKIFLLSFFVVLLLSLSFSETIASEPRFLFYPDGGRVINKEDGFIVDVLLDSAGQEIVSAKFTVLFDTEYLQLRSAERNNSLFVQYPNDDSVTDNDNGVVMLSGFTQSGSGSLYSTVGEPDVFARLTFDVLQEGETVLDWKYEGTGTTFDTVMFKDGSPPQNILLTKPSSATFTISENIVLDPSTVQTGVDVNKYILATGLVLVLFGLFMVLSKPKRMGKKNGTILIYDEE